MIESLSILVGRDIETPGLVLLRGFAGKDSDTANCLIKAYSVFSFCNGTVMFVSQNPDDDTWGVTVNVGTDKWVRYCGLSSVDVSVNKVLSKGTFIGYGNNGKMQLEYCTAEPTEYPVRLRGIQLYKHNPAPLLFATSRILGE